MVGMRVDVTPCPMCGATDQAPGQRIAWGDIWNALEARYRFKIPQPVKADYQTGDSTNLGQCRACGLLYFSPATAGGPDFYELLDTSRGGYYDSLKWEARVVASTIEPHHDVVDFGTGDGKFLRNLPSTRPGRRVGVDHNPSAIASLRACGIEASTEDFEAFAQREAGNFDVVCAMQVLEHVPDVTPLIGSCVQALRPGGRLFVAVPNQERDRDGKLEPLDHPPHHVTRWTRADFHVLADRFGLRVAGFHVEPGERQALWRILERWIPGRRIAWFVSRAVATLTPRSVARAIVPRLAPGASMAGHTLLVELRVA